MDQAGLSRAHRPISLATLTRPLTQDVYYGRKVARTGAAAVLESLG
jgi:hypothetical protein